MLHDPEHIEAPATDEAIVISADDKDILRRLGGEIAEISALPIQKENAGLWKKTNSLKSERPVVWINEIPWNEMNVDDELTLRCEGDFARHLEGDMRRTIYQWNHMRGDMVVNDYLACPKAIHSTDFGIVEDVDALRQDDSSAIKSRHFNVQISEPEDIEKIKMPVVTHNEAATANRFASMSEVFEGIVPVRVVGQSHIWFTPWDYLVRWWGVQEAMMDLVMRPEMVHAAVDRMVDAWMAELDQFAEMNLLELDNNNTRVGSGGYGYVDDLPGDDFDPQYVRPKNMWGCSNAQIFSEVSPEMHWEFGIEHDMRWLDRWGLTYYGCCEPLHRKMELMRRIPNLRKISVSPWCDFEEIFSEIGNDYAISAKPSPAVFTDDGWSAENARSGIREVLDAAGGKGHVELIMKDVSTVNYNPQRVWEWADIAMREVAG
ncbi:MAG: hypothetical protein QGI24_10790 [Kiritimatiellia bacterium]|jgi:hypothetical protein|nr:hypothetical protein [Kiritimatiellia bacterium]MDP6849261.1 hypothetical protein [Kiritimatiellia bacterium]